MRASLKMLRILVRQCQLSSHIHASKLWWTPLYFFVLCRLLIPNLAAGISLALRSHESAHGLIKLILQREEESISTLEYLVFTQDYWIFVQNGVVIIARFSCNTKIFFFLPYVYIFTWASLYSCIYKVLLHKSSIFTRISMISIPPPIC